MTMSPYRKVSGATTLRPLEVMGRLHLSYALTRMSSFHLLDLSFLSDDERQQILNVLNRDDQLRQQEKDRVWSVKLML